jgi:hypothetical protein
MTDNCDVVAHIDNPSTLYCHQERGLLSQVKLFGSYRLPRGVDVAATYQDMVGGDNGLGSALRPTRSTPAGKSHPRWVASSSGANGTVSVHVIEPGSLYLPRLRNLGLRFGKTFGPQVRRLKVMVDIFNALNQGALNIVNNTYGGTDQSWLSALPHHAWPLSRTGAPAKVLKRPERLV